MLGGRAEPPPLLLDDDDDAARAAARAAVAGINGNGCSGRLCRLDVTWSGLKTALMDDPVGETTPPCDDGEWAASQ